ncbi:hypothetical protein JYQ62_00090 [Nostoc sp. UHCC 0702]|nr:hypothetical protein JYQ62_00090 [Nostoc sp. UHCC 0702]
MKKILALIEEELFKFAQLPFFQFLEDPNIPPAEKLCFAPCFTPFVMGYGDLNKFVWLEQPTTDPIQNIINQQICEEENHWIWFLQDLKDLEFNYSLNFTDSLKFNWSNETWICRQTIYELYRYTYKVSPIYKLVAIESIEYISHIFFSKTAPVTQELKLLTNREYPYFGNLHFLAEDQHCVHSYQIKKNIANMHLTEDKYKQACELVSKIFELFTHLVDVLLNFAKKYRGIEEVIKVTSSSAAKKETVSQLGLISQS